MRGAQTMMTAVSTTLRVNVGCGLYPLPGWINVDEDADDSFADMVRRVPPLPFEDNDIGEIYAGHFLEHLEPDDADAFLDEAMRVLVPGGILGLMVPDTREILRRYVLDEPAIIEIPAGAVRDLRDLDELCRVVFYSDVQRSGHEWAYDKFTLRRLLERHGFVVDGEFDRWHDPRVAVGAWYQFGLDAHKPEGR